MADEVVSKLGFDASDVINTLNQLSSSFARYTNAIEKNIGESKSFNAEQKQFVDLLQRIETQAKLTAGAIQSLNGGVAQSGKQLANAANQAAQTNAANAANQLRSQFDTSKANPEQLVKFTTALQTFQTRAAKAGLDVNTLNSIVGNTGQTFSGAAAGVNKAALGVIQLGNSFGQLPPKINQATGAANNFSFSMGNLLKVFTFQQALHGLSAVQNALLQTIPDAIAFERQIAQIATIADSTDNNIDILANRIQDLAAELGKPVAETAAGFYQALSNNIGNADETTAFFTEALKFSKAAVTSVSASVDTLSGVLHSYNLTTADTTHVSDVLFRGIDKGRFTADQLANSLGKVTPTAKALGVSLEEVVGTLVVLTNKGVAVNDAETQLQNVLLKLLRPTEEGKKRLNELGFASAEAGIAIKGGLIPFLEELVPATDRTASGFAEVFNQIRGTRGAIGLLADDGKAATLAISDLKNQAGAMAKAFNTIQSTPAERLTIEMEKLKGILTNDIGRNAIQTLDFLTQKIGGVANATLIAGGVFVAVLGTAGLLALIGQAIAGFTALTGVIFGTTTAAAGLSAALLPIAAVAIPAVLAGLIVFASRVGDVSGDTARKIDQIKRAADIAAKSEAEAVRQAQGPIAQAFQERLQVVGTVYAEIQKVYLKAKDVAITADKAATAAFQSEISQRLSLVTTFLQKLQKIQDDAAQNQKNRTQKLLEFEAQAAQQRFERNIADKTPTQQGNALVQQASREIAAAQVAFKKGNTELAENLLEQAFQNATRAANITETRRQGEFEINRVIEARRALVANENQLEQANAEAAKKLADANNPIATQYREQLQLLEELLRKRAELIKSDKLDKDQLDALDKKIGDAAGTADALGKKFSAAGLTLQGKKLPIVQDLADLQRQLGTGIPLKVKAESALQEFRTTFETEFGKTPLGIKFKLEGFEQAQQDLLKLAEDFKNTQTAQRDVPGARTAANAALRGITETAAGFNKTLENQLQTQFETLPFGKGLADLKQNFRDAQAATKNFAAETVAAIQAVKELDAAGNIPAANQTTIDTQKAKAQALLDQLKQLQSSTDFSALLPKNQALVTEQIQLLQNLIQAIDKAAQARQRQLSVEKQAGADTGTTEKIQKLEQEAGVAKQTADATQAATASAEQLAQVQQAGAIAAEQDALATQQLTADLQLLGPTGITAGTEVISSISAIGPTAISQIGGVFALISALEELAAAQAALAGGGGGGGEFASHGGLMHYFANGGFTARGSDTIPAFLSPGEFVMNAKSTRKFFSQLVAMNSGATPSFHNAGGQVSSNSFGDINVNISSNNASGIDGREIAHALRRELRRGNIR